MDVITHLYILWHHSIWAVGIVINDNGEYFVLSLNQTIVGIHQKKRDVDFYIAKINFS